MSSLGILLLLSDASSAWNEVGHQTIAQFAFQELPRGTRRKVLDILSQHPARSRWVAPEGASPEEIDRFILAKASAWPDVIRGKDDPLHGENLPQAHFINLPYAPDPSFKLPADRSAKVVRQEKNILTQLEWAEATLKAEKSLPEDRARALSWLIHLIGDLHQPLHCATMYSSKLPTGDRGGNDLVVSSETRTIKAHAQGVELRLPTLHAFWDELMGTDAEPKSIAKVVDRCGTHSRADFALRLKAQSYSEWADESYELAVEEAYLQGRIEYLPLEPALTDLKAGRDVVIPAVPPGYRNKAGLIAEHQIAIASYRLASRLEALLGH